MVVVGALEGAALEVPPSPGGHWSFAMKITPTVKKRVKNAGCRSFPRLRRAEAANVAAMPALRRGEERECSRWLDLGAAIGVIPFSPISRIWVKMGQAKLVAGH